MGTGHCPAIFLHSLPESGQCVWGRARRWKMVFSGRKRFAINEASDSRNGPRTGRRPAKKYIQATSLL